MAPSPSSPSPSGHGWNSRDSNGGSPCGLLPSRPAPTGEPGGIAEPLGASMLAVETPWTQVRWVGSSVWQVQSESQGLGPARPAATACLPPPACACRRWLPVAGDEQNTPSGSHILASALTSWPPPCRLAPPLGLPACPLTRAWRVLENAETEIGRCFNGFTMPRAHSQDCAGQSGPRDCCTVGFLSQTLVVGRE